MFSEATFVSLGKRNHVAGIDGGYEVLLSGQGSGIFVPFQMLEAAVSIDEWRLLLFLTDDVPYEEILNISLLDRRHGILETLSLGGAYLNGTFSELRILSDAVSFRFIGDTTWKVGVAEKPFFKFPLIGDPRGVSRPIALSHYLRIFADPAPARADGGR
ncbi:hypothetical protein D781_0106 [Serratia sp. FGI94]|uniref:hypothetical protein n=1 Tax=Serratia sp. FGI94 TaxID=671990 RepID=UPI0002A709CF|nr:hypothetical protein [Serratia sp. FGI94]AGB80501.1 hypothetical protein D781_0106 [Serratia sp. FGI94]